MIGLDAARLCFRQTITYDSSSYSMKKHYVNSSIFSQVGDPNFISKNICSTRILNYLELQNYI